MFWLALKTFFHEKVRLATTLVGIIFSTILTLTQVGMYFGFMGNATAIIRNTDADIWVASKNIQNFDFSNPIPEERINRVRALSEIEWAERIVLAWGFFKLSTGGQEQVQIMGYDPDSGVGKPWSMLVGDTYAVKGGRYMIIDKTSEQRLGKLDIGNTWEISGRKFKLVGISEGIKTFTTAPLIFMAMEQARAFYSPDDVTFIVAKVKERDKVDAVAEALRREMRDNDVYTRDGFIYKTVMYWTVQTGMGMGFFLTAILGVIIGGAIVGQTIYANTMEHMKEFGTLKAIGAKNLDLYKIIFTQAAVGALIGYVSGMLVILLLKGPIEKSGVSLYLSPALFAVLFVVILLTCLLSAYFSIRKVKSLDPVMVFR
ncbi:MAG: FtsX-like permease family protein [Deltaproteobacteria bacterium]|nr:FtsX-like permease family protein [Deltaproteobacteria bacterium]